MVYDLQIWQDYVVSLMIKVHLVVKTHILCKHRKDWVSVVLRMNADNLEGIDLNESTHQELRLSLAVVDV